MATHLGTTVPGYPIPLRKRLDSWKEIAAFFDRDERTVKRWEKERGLPVYRVPGSARGGVFGYADELAEWLQRPSPAARGERVASPAEIVPVAAPPAPSQQNGEWSRSADIAAERIDRISPPSEPGFSAPNPRHYAIRWARPLLWLPPLVLIVVSFLIISIGHRDPRYRKAPATKHVPSAEAQDLYLKGRYYFEKRTAEDLTRAVDFFTQAIVHDPAYAAPYVGLADTYNLLREYSAMPAQEAYPRALAAATKAVELDPSSAEAHNSLAFATFWGFFDAATADREFNRAIELDPNLARAHHWYATFLVEIGRSRQALSEIERARQLDPSSTPILADKGFILAEAGQRELARTLLTQLATSQPEFPHSHRYLADTLYFPEGNFDQYFAESRIVARLQHDADAWQAIDQEQRSYEQSGARGLLEQRLTHAKKLFEAGKGSAFQVADANAALGHYDEALKFLQIAYQRHDLALVTLAVNPSLQPLHQRREFRELVARVGLPPVS